MDPTDRDAAKRQAGRAAAEAVEDGATVGLGTGSTAAAAIEALGRRVDAGLDITGVPTSYQARGAAREAGIPLTAMGDVDRIDVAIDGADQIGENAMVKGGGAAHTREKVIDTAADQFLVVVDESKLAGELTDAVPLAVLPFARASVAETIRELGGEPTLRMATAKNGPVITDDGHLVIDADFGVLEEPRRVARSLSAVPGVVEHGLFVDLADKIYVGRSEGVTVRDL
jgi:ribose 5-phosphate isomerase A